MCDYGISAAGGLASCELWCVCDYGISATGGLASCELWCAARTHELNDALAVSDRSLKRLASNIENELYSYYGAVNSLYKRKYHALVAGLKDAKSMVLVSVVISSLDYLVSQC